MRSLLVKIGILILASPCFLLAAPGGPPAGSPILNSSIYQRGSEMNIDTATIHGILQLPHGVTPPPSFECNVATHTGRIFISTSSTAGLARIYVCEGVNGWQVKSSTGGSGGGGTTVPGGTNTQFQYNNSGSFAGSANLVNSASSVTATAFNTSTLTVSNYSSFLNVSTSVWQSVSTITYNSGILVDMSRIANASLSEGFVIPQSANCANATRNGQICWDSDDHFLYMGNGSGIQPAVTVGASTLGVSQGTTLVSSPTALVNLNANQFNVSAVSVTTATISLNSSSATLQGNTFNDANQLVKTDGSAIANVPGFNATTASYLKGFQDWHILAIYNPTTTTATLVANTAFQNTTLTQTLTPKLSTSQFIIVPFGTVTMGVGASGYVTLARNGTNLYSTHGFSGILSNNTQNVSSVLVDAPVTTSAITYTIRIRSDSGAVGIQFPSAAFGAPNPVASMLIVEVAQ